MILHGFSDGASRGNPGESGIGIVIRTPEGEELLAEGHYIGKTTNNIAEYTAFLTLLDKVRRMACSRLVAHSDSELMVRQLNGTYKVRNAQLREYHQKARDLLARLPFPVEIRHVFREQNREADRLANLGIDRHLQVSQRV
jgi:ribonuclease HI